jgi:hypothetical protein
MDALRKIHAPESLTDEELVFCVSYYGERLQSLYTIRRPNEGDELEIRYRGQVLDKLQKEEARRKGQ